MLKMKKACETCHVKTPHVALAYICSYECTFCESCSEKTAFVCPTCQGELVKRPTCVKGPLSVVATQLKDKLMRK